MITLLGVLNPQGNGQVTLSNPDGSVVSVNPSGNIETRPPGTNGAWELATRDGVLLIYQPVNPGPQFVFSLVKPQ